MEKTCNRCAATCKLHVVEDRSLEMGDVAVIDFTGYIDREPFDGGQEDIPWNRFQSFIPGFEPQLVGMNIERRD